jgi:hypothetical protein
MKRFLAVAAVALAAVAVYATVAPAGPNVVTPKQFGALSKKVTALQKKLTSVSKELRAFESCVPTGAVAIARFGDDMNQTEGYRYQGSDGNDFLTSALDLASAQDVQAYMLVTDAQCAAIINRGKKTPVSLGAAHK